MTDTNGPRSLAVELRIGGNAYIDWPEIPNPMPGFVCRVIVRTPKETDHARWRREMNAWHPQAMATRGRHKPRTQ